MNSTDSTTRTLYLILKPTATNNSWQAARLS